MIADQKHVGDGPTVFVVTDDGTKDFSPALEHGTLVVMLPPKRQLFTVRVILDELRAAGLDLYDPQHDSIVPTGDPAIIGLVCAYVAQRHGEFSVLKWDGRERKYFRITVPLPKESK